MLIVGVDENGLGPLLGPLVVTAAAFEVERYDPQQMWTAKPAGLDADDSKVLFSRSKLARAERHTRAWLAAFGVDAHTHAELVEHICAPLPWPLPCPGELPPICTPDPQPLPAWDSAEPVPCDTPGIEPRRVRSMIACPGAFNTAVARPGMNKLRLDFELMLHLLSDVATAAGTEIHAICGKVGSTRRYGPWLDGMGRWLWSAIDERPASSTYRVAGLGTVSFVRDADSAHLPVAVASMVGKYLRELAMLRLNRQLGGDPDRPASGYRDPVTASFVDETTERRRRMPLADTCFTRLS